MRARIVLLSVLMLVSGCRTRPLTGSGTAALELTGEEQDTAAALAHFALGSFYDEARGAHDLASIRQFELASEYDPARHRIRSKVAVGYLMRRQPSKAVAVLEESCRRNPNELGPLVDLAVTCQIAGQFDKALDNITKAIALAPGESALYATAAKIHIHRTEDDAAIRILRRGLHATNTAELAPLISARARQLIGEKDLAGSLRYLLLLRDNTSEASSPDLLNLIGQLYLEVKNPEEAAAAFTQAAATGSAPPATFTKLGATQMYLESPKDAIASLELGRKTYPENTRILFSLALAYNAVDRVDAAYDVLQTIKHLADTDPDKKLSIEFYITYGATADNAGHSLAAEKAFETCIALYPEAAQALNYMAYLWAESGENLDEAMAYVTRALEIDPENAAFIDTLAWVLYRKGEYDAARDHLQSALAIIPDEPVINEHMGDVYDALDAPEKARHYWTMSLMGDPDNRWVRWKLEAAGADLAPLLRRARKVMRQKKDRD